MIPVQGRNQTLLQRRWISSSRYRGRKRDSQFSMIPPVLRKRPETGVADMQQRHLNKGVSLSSALVQLNNLDKRPAFHTRNELKNAKRVVIKLGSTVVTR